MDNTFKLLQVPDSVVGLVFVFALILVLAPYAGGKDLGIFKVPTFRATAKRRLKWGGPVLLLALLLCLVPLWKSPEKKETAAPTINQTFNGNVGTVITIQKLEDTSIALSPTAYVVHSTQDSLHLEVGGVLPQDMVARVSVVSSGSGLYSIDRLYIKLHGYARSELRDEFSTIAAFGSLQGYKIQLSADFDEYDLVPLRPFARHNVWQYKGNDFDEFRINFATEPYTLFVISFEMDGRDLKQGKPVHQSSGYYQLIWVKKGNTGGALDLQRWYTPEKLVLPQKRRYDAGIETGEYQLLTVDFSEDPGYLTEIDKATLRGILPGLRETVMRHGDNSVFRQNLEKIESYLKER